jgi:hypothetical protein
VLDGAIGVWGGAGRGVAGVYVIVFNRNAIARKGRSNLLTIGVMAAKMPQQTSFIGRWVAEYLFSVSVFFDVSSCVRKPCGAKSDYYAYNITSSALRWQ